jgi:hypothetical protein
VVCCGLCCFLPPPPPPPPPPDQRPERSTASTAVFVRALGRGRSPVAAEPYSEQSHPRPPSFEMPHCFLLWSSESTPPFPGAAAGMPSGAGAPSHPNATVRNSTRHAQPRPEAASLSVITLPMNEGLTANDLTPSGSIDTYARQTQLRGCDERIVVFCWHFGNCCLRLTF